MDKFAHEAKEYDPAPAAFRDYLKKNNVTLSDRMADILLKNQVYTYKKRPVYDLEFDDQLTAAMDV
jgi:hypothetical protein